LLFFVKYFHSSFLEPSSKKPSQITQKTRKSTSQPSTTISTVYFPQTSTIYSQGTNATTPTTSIPQTTNTFDQRTNVPVIDSSEFQQTLELNPNRFTNINENNSNEFFNSPNSENCNNFSSWGLTTNESTSFGINYPQEKLMSNTTTDSDRVFSQISNEIEPNSYDNVDVDNTNSISNELDFGSFHLSTNENSISSSTPSSTTFSPPLYWTSTSQLTSFYTPNSIYNSLWTDTQSTTHTNSSMNVNNQNVFGLTDTGTFGLNQFQNQQNMFGQSEYSRMELKK
jgi:hypothetical protein